MVVPPWPPQSILCATTNPVFHAQGVILPSLPWVPLLKEKHEESVAE